MSEPAISKNIKDDFITGAPSLGSPSREYKKYSLRRVLYAVVFFLIAIPAVKILLYAVYSLNHNFHEVIPGELYRASSMMSRDLQDTIDKYKIRTVFDLRTHASTKDKHGVLESLSVHTAGAQYVHFRMETLKELTPEQVLNLIALYHQAVRPVLIHCSSGSERTSVAVAIWLMTQSGKGAREAADQLALSYGYLKPWLVYKEWYHKHPTINRTVEDYFDDERNAQLPFKDWIVNKQLQQDTSTPLRQPIESSAEQ